MSRCSLIWAAALSFALVPALWAADNSPPKTTTLHGTIKTVDTKAMTVVLALKGHDTAPGKVNDKTTITVDGKEAKLDALKEGMKADVKVDSNLVIWDIKAVTAK